MTSLLHQLENNEAILLMYLADELSAEDRAEVEQMLASDASMRAELERLTAIRGETVAGLEQLDAATRLPVAENVAVRRAMRMMRQWQVDRATAPPPPEVPINELRFPWWSYPLTTAAVVLIAFLVWWGNRSDLPRRPIAQNMEYVPAGSSDLDGMRSEVAADMLAESFDLSDDELFQMVANQRIDDAMRALAAMSEQPGDM